MDNDDGGNKLDRQGQENNGEGIDIELSEANESVSLTKTEIFTVLQNPRRRETLKYLERNEGEAVLSDLAEFIAARENDIEVETVSSEQRKRVYISLYQVHLPKMDDLGVIEFEKQRGTIELTDAGAILFPYLHFDPHSNEQASEEEDSTPLSTVRDRLSRFVRSGEN